MRLITSLIYFLLIFSVPAEEPSKELNKKLDIVIPKLKADNLTFKETISLLRKETIKNDPEKTGINIILLESPKRFMEDPVDLIKDPFAEEDPFAEGAQFEDDNKKLREVRYGFDFEKMPVKECIKYICMMNRAQYRYDSNAVVIASSNMRFKVNLWSDYKLLEKMSSYEDKIKRLQKELEVLKKIKALPKKKEKKEVLKEDIVLPKVRFQNASFLMVTEYMERQSEFFTSDKKKIPFAIYIPADVKLDKVNIEANNIQISDLAKYVAEQLKIDTAVEKGEITFREAKRVKSFVIEYNLSHKQFMFLYGPEMSIEKGLEKFGINSPRVSHSNKNSRRKFTMINTKENHEKLKKILELIED